MAYHISMPGVSTIGLLLTKVNIHTITSREWSTRIGRKHDYRIDMACIDQEREARSRNVECKHEFRTGLLATL